MLLMRVGSPSTEKMLNFVQGTQGCPKELLGQMFELE